MDKSLPPVGCIRKDDRGMRHGDTLLLGKQMYDYLGHIPHVTRDGRDVDLILLATACATCGDRFYLRVREYTLVSLKSQARRCRAHVSRTRVGSPAHKLECAEVKADRAEARLRAISEIMA